MFNQNKQSYIQKACEITDFCFSEILPFIKPGVTEAEVASKLNTLFRKYNVKPAFIPIVAFGSHTSIVHYLDAKTSTTKCRKQEIILLDFGVKVNGYCSDMTRMIFVGKPKKEWVYTYNTIRDIQKICIEKIKVYKGRSFSGGTLDRFARRLIKKAGLPPYPHGLGHSIGKEVHELPKLSRKKDAQIKPGMIVTIEPGAYIKNDYGVRIEDTVLLKEDGVEMLTNSNRNIIIQ